MFQSFKVKRAPAMPARVLLRYSELKAYGVREYPPNVSGGE